MVLKIINNKAFAYIRISTKKQEKDQTRKTQEMLVKEYAKRNNLEIIEIFKDLEDYEQLDNMMDRLDEVLCVIINDWSCISCNMLFSGYLLYEFSKHNVTIHDVFKNNIVELDNDTGILMRNIESFLASQEKKKIKHKQKAGIRRKIEEVGHWGRIRRVLTPKEINTYQKLREANVSKSAIARLLKISRTVLYRNIKELGLDEIKTIKVNQKIDDDE